MRIIVLLSPAKSLNWDKAPDSFSSLWSEPPLLSDADPIIEVMRSKSKSDLKSLMSVSDSIAELNYERYQGYLFASEARRKMKANCDESDESTRDVFRPAALAYDGPAYRGMDASSFSKQDWSYGKDSIRLLSGLYGVVRPTDLIQPYRLEMGSRVGALGTKDLYSYWREKVTQRLIQDAQETTPALGRGRRGSGQDPSDGFLVVNVASQEYSKVVDFDAVRNAGGEVIDCVFKDDGRVLAVFAKRARGLLARHIVSSRARNAADVKSFAAEGYRLDNAQSGEGILVFTRSKGERPGVAPSPPPSIPTPARGEKRSAPATSPGKDAKTAGTGRGGKRAASKPASKSTPDTRRVSKSTRRKG